MFKNLLSKMRTRYTAVCIAVVAVAMSAFPALASATESEAATKVKGVATEVSTEGTTIILAVLGALAALIALVIVLPKAIGFIRRFV